MKTNTGTGQARQLAAIINEHHAELLDGWMAGLIARLVRRDKIAENELRQQASQFLPLLAGALESGDSFDIEGAAWDDTRQLLTEISESRVRQGYAPIDTASFMFSLKEPLFAYLRKEITAQPQQLGDAIVSTSNLFDELGLLTIAVYQKAREQVILRQQQELLELSTPVVQLWQDVLALPLIGTLDSARTQVVMENLLQKIVDTGALIAIIDITGVPTVDTLVAQHLLKTVAAARLMGADCIISGIRPQIAQTIVHLGVNLEDVVTKATLADAFVVALKRTGSSIAYGQQHCEARMDKIPILRMGRLLLVTIQVDMHDRLAMTLQDDLTTRIVTDHAKGVLIDISALDIVDSFIGRMIGNTAAMAKILGARTVVVGMQPAVAITLVELGLTLEGVSTALNVERGIRLLERDSEWE